MLRWRCFVDLTCIDVVFVNFWRCCGIQSTPMSLSLWCISLNSRGRRVPFSNTFRFHHSKKRIFHWRFRRNRRTIDHREALIAQISPHETTVGCFYSANRILFFVFAANYEQYFNIKESSIIANKINITYNNNRRHSILFFGHFNLSEITNKLRL